MKIRNLFIIGVSLIIVMFSVQIVSSMWCRATFEDILSIDEEVEPSSTTESIPEHAIKPTPEPTPDPTPDPTAEPTPEPEKVYLGTFRVTRYCGCEICNGPWVGQPTASGTELTDGRTIAVDSDVIPLGSKVEIEGIGTRVAEDTGSAIVGNRIDLFVDAPHDEIMDMGVTYNDVYLILE